MPRPAKIEYVSLRYNGQQTLKIGKSTWEAWGVTNQHDVIWEEANGYMADISVEAAIELARYRHNEFEASVFGQIPERLRYALEGVQPPPTNEEN